MQNNKRQLSQDEIEALEFRYCTAEDWNTIRVADNFNPKSLRNVHFYGYNELGEFTRDISLYDNLHKPSGIYDASLSNCTVGNNVLIHGVNHIIANYDIEDDVVIKNTDEIIMTGRSTFGNGIKVAVLDESGGRAVPIFDRLNAPLAYIMSLYRHLPKVQEKLLGMIDQYANQVCSERGIISKQSKIMNCHSIKNVKFGVRSRAEGVHRLENGSINSNAAAPSCVGSGVIARNFILSSGSEISDGAIVENCFVGQGCQLSKQYSAENSLFFANCQGFHGEACSLFAGPYTVTHHKSTLLIAGLFSFMNAGSGSNQSNHMYKLGPIHHGIAQRGSKSTSDSYLLWPAKIGPFTLIMGRHYKNSDTSDLPFSYLIENKDESCLVPAVNLRSVGTIRDALKWPKRDKRMDPDKLDPINFNLLSPFSIQKMVNGQTILLQLQATSGETSQTYSYSSTTITNSALRSGIKLYEIGITKFLGNSVITRLKDAGFTTEQEMQERLIPETEKGSGNWLDLAGMIAPKKEIADILKDVENGIVTDLDEIMKSFCQLHANYYHYEWTWAADLLEKRLGKKVTEMTVNDIIKLVKKWKESVVSLDRMIYDDAKKEFTLSSKTSFGPDGNEETRSLDFEEVRGSFETNPFVKEIIDHIDRKSKLGDYMIAQLEAIETR